ncbi:conserved protein of unknown function [Shewanella benthica]|uniref:Uncharacterized protein n=1 Tax=Shewanella benthica TaxID=43661 RepID=A0A330M2P6_9GAMM|nr:hypothetical protein [Shewanella benthica]SQH75714.1 conserved protein of unknown function [Shewanella benthica]
MNVTGITAQGAAIGADLSSVSVKTSASSIGSVSYRQPINNQKVEDNSKVTVA